MKHSQNPKKFKITSGGLAFCFFIITRFIAITLSLPCITDISLYLGFYVKDQIFGMIPYQQFPVEYPPLALLISYLPGFFVKENISFDNYYVTFALMMFFIDFCCLKTCQFYCRNNLAMKDKEIAYMTVIYSLLGLLLFKIIYHRLDMAVCLFFVLSLVFFQAKNSQLKSRFFINGLLGFFYKIIPAFNVPIAIITKAFHDSDLKKIITKICLNSAVFAFCLFAVIFALEIFTHHTFLQNMMFHQERGIQIESSYGSFLMFKNLLFGGSQIYYSHSSWNVEGNYILEFIAKILGNLVILFFYAAIFLILLQKKIRHKKFHFSEKDFLESTLIVTLLFLSFQRVLSTQFFIWLIPLLAIWLAKNRSLKSLIIFSFIYFCTFFIFSIDYFALAFELPILVIILALRNFILVGFTCFITINFLKNLHEQN